MKCNLCNEFNGYLILNNEYFCSNCYKFKSDGIYNYIPKDELVKLAFDKFINRDKINKIHNIISNQLDLSIERLNELIDGLYITSDDSKIFYDLLCNRNNSYYNILLEHILCSRVVNYWNQKLSIGSCYYGNYEEIPKSLEELELILSKNYEKFCNKVYN